MSTQTAPAKATAPSTAAKKAPAKPRARRRVTTPQKPFYRALKRLQVGKRVYKPGQVVPQANSWPRVDAWVRSRHLELVE